MNPVTSGEFYGDNTLLNGKYFRGIDDWFADTFPFREQFLALNNTIRKAYGIKTTEIHALSARQTISPTPSSAGNDLCW